MKKWIFGILIILVIAGIVALDKSGIISWKPLSMLIAAIAAPFRLVVSIFSDKEAEIREKHAKIRQVEGEYQTGLQSKIRERQGKIEALESEFKILDTKLADLRHKRAQIDAEVDAMSAEELGAEVRRLAGA
jgi:septal ring factor EnvC (AmiA/AmiB activator)